MSLEENKFNLENNDVGVIDVDETTSDVVSSTSTTMSFEQFSNTIKMKKRGTLGSLIHLELLKFGTSTNNRKKRKSHFSNPYKIFILGGTVGFLLGLVLMLSLIFSIEKEVKSATDVMNIFASNYISAIFFSIMFSCGCNFFLRSTENEFLSALPVDLGKQFLAKYILTICITLASLIPSILPAYLYILFSNLQFVDSVAVITGVISILLLGLFSCNISFLTGYLISKFIRIKYVPEVLTYFIAVIVTVCYPLYSVIDAGMSVQNGTDPHFMNGLNSFFKIGLTDQIGTFFMLGLFVISSVIAVLVAKFVYSKDYFFAVNEENKGKKKKVEVKEVSTLIVETSDVSNISTVNVDPKQRTEKENQIGKRLKKEGLYTFLLKQDLRNSFSPSVFARTIMGNIFQTIGLLIISIVLYFLIFNPMKDQLGSYTFYEVMPLSQTYVFILISYFFTLVPGTLGIFNLASTAISRDKDNLFIYKSLHVDFYKYLLVKTIAPTIASSILTIVVGIAVSLAFSLNPLSAFLMILSVILFTYFMINLFVVYDFYRPNLNYSGINNLFRPSLKFYLSSFGFILAVIPIGILSIPLLLCVTNFEENHSDWFTIHPETGQKIVAEQHFLEFVEAGPTLLNTVTLSAFGAICILFIALILFEIFYLDKKAVSNFNRRDL